MLLAYHATRLREIFCHVFRVLTDTWQGARILVGTTIAVARGTTLRVVFRPHYQFG
jgi:hypothetical protein